MVQLDIPYKSQLGASANKHLGDCGPACVAMAGHRSTSVDAVSDATGKPRNRGTTFQQMYVGLAWARVSFRYQRPLRLTDIRSHIDNGNPSIMILNYGRIPSKLKENQRFTGAHFALAVGYDDAGLFVHDPLWNGDGGAYIHWPDNVVDFAMAKPGWSNLSYQGIVIKKKFELIRPSDDHDIPPDDGNKELLDCLHELYDLLGVIWEGVPLHVAQSFAIDAIEEM